MKKLQMTETNLRVTPSTLRRLESYVSLLHGVHAFVSALCSPGETSLHNKATRHRTGAFSDAQTVGVAHALPQGAPLCSIARLVLKLLLTRS